MEWSLLKRFTQTCDLEFIGLNASVKIGHLATLNKAPAVHVDDYELHNCPGMDWLMANAQASSVCLAASWIGAMSAFWLAVVPHDAAHRGIGAGP